MMVEMMAEMDQLNAKITILRRENESKISLADSLEKDKLVVEQERQAYKEECQGLRKLNSFVFTLAEVKNKAQWANSVR